MSVKSFKSFVTTRDAVRRKNIPGHLSCSLIYFCIVSIFLLFYGFSASVMANILLLITNAIIVIERFIPRCSGYNKLDFVHKCVWNGARGEGGGGVFLKLI